MDVLHRSTVTWKGSTVEEREAGQGWLTLTWPRLVLPALKDWNKCHSMDFLTVVGSHLDGAVCLQYYILPSGTSRCVDKWLDIRRNVLMHIRTSANINQVYFDGLSIFFMAVLVYITTYGHTQLGIVRMIMITPLVHVTQEAHTSQVPSYVGCDYYCESWTNGDCSNVAFSPMSCGIGSSVTIWRLPAAHTPTCRGSSRHSTQLTTLNWKHVLQMMDDMVLCLFSWLSFTFANIPFAEPNGYMWLIKFCVVDFEYLLHLHVLVQYCT